MVTNKDYSIIFNSTIYYPKPTIDRFKRDRNYIKKMKNNKLLRRLRKEQKI